MKRWYKHAVLTAEEMYEADRRTIAGGTPGLTLMQNAGAQSAEIITRHYQPGPTLVLCGTGNNGGDGFIVACKLREAGWPVTLTCTGNPQTITGDAAPARDAWLSGGGTITLWGSAEGGRVPPEAGNNDAGIASGKTQRESNLDLSAFRLCVDAVFGIGLTRPVAGRLYAMFVALRTARIPTIALDIPSGIHADTGAEFGISLPADRTVTFFRPKLGHILAPGRYMTSALHVVDIGIPEQVLNGIRPRHFLNHPDLWSGPLPSEFAVLGAPAHQDIYRQLRDEGRIWLEDETARTTPEASFALLPHMRLPFPAPPQPQRSLLDRAQAIAGAARTLVLILGRDALLMTPSGTAILNRPSQFLP